MLAVSAYYLVSKTYGLMAMRTIAPVSGTAGISTDTAHRSGSAFAVFTNCMSTCATNAEPLAISALRADVSVHDVCARVIAEIV